MTSGRRSKATAQKPSSLTPTDPIELARVHPQRAAEGLEEVAVLATWPIDAVAAIVASVPLDHPVSRWAETNPQALWRISRWVADPDRAPRDWAGDLLVALAKIASRLVEPWATEKTDLLGAPFHIHHRHATAEQLAWIDAAGLTLDQVLLLGRHPRADARVLSNVLFSLHCRWHEGPEVTDAHLERAHARLVRAPPAVPLGPPPRALAAAVHLLVGGDDQAVRDALARTTHEVIFHRLLHVPDLEPRSRIELLLRVATLGFGWQRSVAMRRLLHRPDITAGDLERIAHGVHADDLAALLADDRPTPEALRVLWQRMPNHQHLLVKHVNAPVDLLDARSDLRAFALESTTNELWLVAALASLRGTPGFTFAVRNPRCPPEVVAEVQASHVVLVRGLVAAHPRASAESLRALASDPDVGVRELVATNPMTPPEVLASLATDPDPPNRREVAHHRSAPCGVLEMLAVDPDRRVRAAAAARLPGARLAQGLLGANEITTATRALRRDAAARTQIAKEVQALLVVDDDASVREALATSLGVRLEHLAHLASDPEPRVRRAVASSVRTPAEVRERLARDPRRWVSRAASERLGDRH